MKRTFKDLKTMKEKVKFLLTENQLLRDDDKKLIGAYYFNEIGKEQLDSMSAMDFLTELFSSRTASFESIMRIRRKIQKECPELQGLEYGMHKSRQETFFKINIRQK